MVGLPIYEHDWDFKPAALMWFFDSRSFVSGTGNGPGESPWQRIALDAVPLILIVGPIPDDAKKYWIDETTVPYYIESQALLMKLLVCSPAFKAERSGCPADEGTVG